MNKILYLKRLKKVLLFKNTLKNASCNCFIIYLELIIENSISDVTY